MDWHCWNGACLQPIKCSGSAIFHMEVGVLSLLVLSNRELIRVRQGLLISAVCPLRAIKPPRASPRCTALSTRKSRKSPDSAWAPCCQAPDFSGQGSGPGGPIAGCPPLELIHTGGLINGSIPRHIHILHPCVQFCKQARRHRCRSAHGGSSNGL